MLAQKQTIHQQKALDLSYLEPEGQGRGMFRRVPRPLAAKDIEKKSKFNGAKSGRKIFFFSIWFFIFLCYELSACPLILYSNKVCFASSLIARPNISTVKRIWDIISTINPKVVALWICCTNCESESLLPVLQIQAQAKLDPYKTSPSRSILQNQSMTTVLPVLLPMAPLFLTK